MHYCSLNTIYQSVDANFILPIAQSIAIAPDDDQFSALLKTAGKVLLIASSVLFALPSLGLYPYFIYRIFQKISEIQISKIQISGIQISGIQEAEKPPLALPPPLPPTSVKLDSKPLSSETIFALMKKPVLPPLASEEPRPDEQLRVQQILSTLVSRPRGRLSDKATASLEKIASIFAKSLPKFAQMYEKHALYDAIAVVTQEVKQQPDLQKEWRMFLDTKPQCILPDEKITSLDFSMEIRRLEDRLPSLKASCLDQNTLKMGGTNILFPASLKEDIGRVFRESFLIPDDMLLPDVSSRCSRELCVVAQDEQSREVYGVLFVGKYISAIGKEFLYINSVCRQAKAAQLGVGMKLFEKLFEVMKSDDELNHLDKVLHVHKDNTAALALYKKFKMSPSSDSDTYATPALPVAADNLMLLLR